MSFTRDHAAELCGRVAALSRAGLPSVRIWQVLADNHGPSAEAASIVASMLAVGGSTAEGLRLASNRLAGTGVDALAWLAVTTEVIDRSGAPAALILDQVEAGLLAEIAQGDELQVALAGPRATASVLAGLPLAGAALGALIGVNSLAVLFGTTLGRISLVSGGIFWAAGRFWSARLLRSALRARP